MISFFSGIQSVMDVDVPLGWRRRLRRERPGAFVVEAGSVATQSEN
jgi:hypothetical protein